jgi:hypothetical protein
VLAAVVALVVMFGSKLWVDRGVEAGTARQEAEKKDVEAEVAKNIEKPVEKSEDVQSIRDVLAQDKTYSDVLQERVRAIQRKDIEAADSMAQYFDDYVKAAENIDTRRCPRDFAEAYYRSIIAKSEVAEMSRAHPQIPTGDEATARKIWKYMQGDPTGGDDQLQGEVLSWVLQLIGKMKQSQERWQEVQNIAARYGAA